MNEVRPSIYLVTPEDAAPDALLGPLEAALATGLVACLRLSLASSEEEAWRRAAESLRAVTDAHDVAFVVRDHFRLAVALGLDGVHLSDTRTPVRTARKELGEDRIVGAFAGSSRHQGMVVAEAGADYVSFGPVGNAGALGDGNRAGADVFAWWAEMIETPVVAEGGVTLAEATALKGSVDFVVPETGIWREADIAAAVRRYAEALT